MVEDHKERKPEKGQSVHERRRLFPRQEDLHKRRLPEHKRPGRHHRQRGFQRHRVRTNRIEVTEPHIVRQEITNVQGRQAACDHHQDQRE